jgi:hypothetical protein
VAESCFRGLSSRSIDAPTRVGASAVIDAPRAVAVRHSRLHGELDVRTPIDVENVYNADAIPPSRYRLDEAFAGRRIQADSPPCCVGMSAG